MPNKPDVHRWKRYYRRQMGRPPHRLLLETMSLFGDFQGSAIDLGCGAGIETLVLLEAGWEVLANDIEPLAIKLLESKTPVQLRKKLQTWNIPFEHLDPIHPVDLIFGAFSLPFCHPGFFPNFWGTLTKVIKPGGRFAGQFFGQRDGWAPDPDKTFHTPEQVSGLFRGFEIESFEEENRNGTTRGTTKRWHVFHVIARKLDPSHYPQPTVDNKMQL